MKDSEVRCSHRDRGGECAHLSSFGRSGRQGGGWEIYPGGEWEVPVLQSSGLGGI